MADMKIRDFLTGRGNKDSDITYNNGNVYLKGKQFMGAAPKADGSTYGDSNALNSAYNNYSMSDALDKVNTRLNAPRQAYGGFDPNSDQAYQSALGAAQRSAQTAGNNATVRLGARGIGNSQQALTTENQIQQRSVADVNSNILPQLMGQHYNRWMDQQNLDRQGTQDLLGLAGTYNNLGQQDRDNQYRDNTFAEGQKQSRIDLAKWGQGMYGFGDAKMDTQTFFDQYDGAKTLPVQQFDYGKTQDTIANTRADKMQAATISNMSSDNARANAADARAKGDKEMALRFEAWDRTGVAPPGIPNVEPGTPLAAKPSSSSPSGANKNELEAQYVTGFDSLTPAMRKKAFADEKAAIIKDLGKSGYDALYKTYFDEDGDPR